MFVFIMLPSRDRHGIMLGYDALVHVRELALGTFVAKCGGATCYEGHGIWRSANGAVMHEDVTRCEAWCEASADIDWLRALAVDIAKAANQESVMFGTTPGSASFT